MRKVILSTIECWMTHQQALDTNIKCYGGHPERNGGSSERKLEKRKVPGEDDITDLLGF